MDEVLGYIEDIVFVNPENGFTVAKFKDTQKREMISIVGSLPSVQPGETLLCQGSWKTHSSFGKQFEVSSYEVRSPCDLLGIQKYLESGMIKGIGPVYAKRIIDTFGIRTLKIIDEKPEQLLKIPGIGDKRIAQIKSCWDEQKSIREVMIFLRSYGISPAYAQKIFKKYGLESIKISRENPYRLAKEITGIGFKIADAIAQKIGFDKLSSYRIDAAIEHALWELTGEGHCCFPKNGLLQVVEKLLDIPLPNIEKELARLILDKTLISQKMAVNDSQQEFIWLSSLYYFEQKIAEELFRLQNNSSKLRSVDREKAITWVQKKLSIDLAAKQKEAVQEALYQKVHIITGGPGTGKSTITKAILAITEEISSSIILAAPTGRAAKRLSQITRKKASTIHSLLEFDFIGGGFKRNKENPLSCQLIIIDEASMIDTMLLYHLLNAIPDGARVLLVGDIDQLPSVGAGNVLKDLIASEKISLTRLTEIFRQAAGSKIILNAHRINQGIFPIISNEAKSDFLFYEVQEPEAILGKILSLVKEELPKTRGFHAVDDIQVLAPMKRGIIGIENLNLQLQEKLNPSTKPLFRAGLRLHLHDKVMQIRNNYTKLVYNGDVGTISSIDLLEQEVIVNYDGRLVSYAFTELEEITLAYAVSVHKYQGSECPCIVMPIHTCHFKLLYRNLLYTGVTRGKKLVVLIGSKQALAIAIKNANVQERYTGLKKALNEVFQRKSILTQTKLL